MIIYSFKALYIYFKVASSAFVIGVLEVKLFFSLSHWFKKSICQFLAKECAQVLINP